MREVRTAGVVNGRPESLEAPGLLVSCFWCERIHSGDHPLSVCSECRKDSTTLRSLDMRGSYPLNYKAVDDLPPRTSPGNFALGYMDGDSFSVFFVGRSDGDIKACLREWVGMPSHDKSFSSNAKGPWNVLHGGSIPSDVPARSGAGNVDGGYTHFAYSYSDSSLAAFAKELRNFDDFGGCWALDNSTEPVAATT